MAEIIPFLPIFRHTHTQHTHTHTQTDTQPLPLPLQDRKGEDTRRGRTSSEAHRVGDSYHRPATHVSLLAASVSVPVVVRDCQ